MEGDVSDVLDISAPFQADGSVKCGGVREYCGVRLVGRHAVGDVVWEGVAKSTLDVVGVILWGCMFEDEGAERCYPWVWESSVQLGVAESASGVCDASEIEVYSIGAFGIGRDQNKKNGYECEGCHLVFLTVVVCQFI